MSRAKRELAPPAVVEVEEEVEEDEEEGERETKKDTQTLWPNLDPSAVAIL